MCIQKMLTMYYKNDETIDHLFFSCSVARIIWVIWRCRNDIVLDRKNITQPMGIVKMMCGWISDWAILQRKDPEEKS